MMFLSSLGSLGRRRTLSSSSTSARRGSRVEEFFLGHGADVGVGFGEHGFGVGDAGLDGAVLAEFFDGGLHVAVLLGDGLELLLVVDEGGVGHLMARGRRSGLRVGRGGQTWVLLGGRE